MKTNLKTVVIHQSLDICTGLMLAGAETHHVTGEEGLKTVLATIDPTNSLIILDPALADLDTAKEFAQKNKNSLITKGPEL